MTQKYYDHAFCHKLLNFNASIFESAIWQKLVGHIKALGRPFMARGPDVAGSLSKVAAQYV